ncbi:MAG: nucleoside/nucleotide kinase family protein [Burkholderiaceae bacterium]|nr:nucleoside/nucleotide kinase family protein [Microbacteriaceae bacterium]
MTIEDDASTAPIVIADAQLDGLARRAITLLRPGARVVLGITGSPGAGKTTLAINLARRVNVLLEADVAVHVPMDGFHLANATLDRLGIHDRKGAIDTFDGWGFVALLGRLSTELDHAVYAPGFDRAMDEGVAAQIAVLPGVSLVIVEGNYLLADIEPWPQVAGLLAESWFCETGEDERLRRLIDRHEKHGRSPEAARAWVDSVDGRNAILIETTRVRADLTISGEAATVLGV